MQSDQQFLSKKAVPPLANQVGKSCMHIPFASSFAADLPPAAKHLTAVDDIQFQASEVCPKNFIIFDQNDHQSQIMFNPAIANIFPGPTLNFRAASIQENFEREDNNNIENEISHSTREDLDDIDALLSLEDEENEEYDEEEVSTARTYGNYGSNSPDSCSSYGFKFRKNGSSDSIQKSSGTSSDCNSDRKRQNMKKMVKALRGIVPGGDQMSTAAVLDEAVRYLKSLKVGVQKLGVGNINK